MSQESSIEETRPVGCRTSAKRCVPLERRAFGKTITQNASSGDVEQAALQSWGVQDDDSDGKLLNGCNCAAAMQHRWEHGSTGRANISLQNIIRTDLAGLTSNPAGGEWGEDERSNEE